MAWSLLSLLPATLTALWVDKAAVYVLRGDEIVLCFGGTVTKISRAMLRERAAQRGADASPETLESLINDSLVPLTVENPGELPQAATKFLSAFTPQAVWRAGTAEDFLAGEDGSTPATVFLRRRYPLVSWEWQIETPGADTKGDTGHGFQLLTAWTAWAVPSSENFHETRGHVEDWIERRDEVLLIARRRMVIDNLVRPRDMRTTALFLLDPERERGLVAGLRRAGNKAVAALERLSGLSSTLVAISALLSSVQGIVAEYSSVGGLILGSLGSLVASLTVLSLSVASLTHALHTAAATRFGEDGDGEAEVTEQGIADWEMVGVGAAA
ncbi:hypothetical protein AURDEDRAFT_183635 [Auricularia subglabra TFB-10046 SS5]|nr:hypothetical protein AURDEDRAFT_183635 [Auricularia subglabra TFB-10046 SS5]